MSSPLIGITTSRTLNNYSYPTMSLAEAYVRALAQAGASPVLIPLGLPESALKQLLPRLDGILLSGGGDLHPQSYGSEPHRLVTWVDEDRDRVEISLLQDAVKQGTPFLGICRGLQLVNVALGGSLYEDILEQRPNSMKHDRFPEQSRDYLAHVVQIEPDSALARILKLQSVEVNSMHHQGIRSLASGLCPIAHATDGLVEAIELPEHPFGLAVQWHPEWLQAHLTMRFLFQAFVQAASK